MYQVSISHGLGRVSDTCISGAMRCVSGVYQVSISRGWGGAADTCISDGIRRVSGVYQVRISHGFGAWLIRVSAVVSSMYQECIRYVSAMALVRG